MRRISTAVNISQYDEMEYQRADEKGYEMEQASSAQT